jgi:hypothetical protein
MEPPQPAHKPSAGARSVRRDLYLATRDRIGRGGARRACRADGETISEAELAGLEIEPALLGIVCSEARPSPN